MVIQPGRLEPARADGSPMSHVTGAKAAGQFHCVECGYGVTVREQLPRCPMCGGEAWQSAGASPAAPLLSG